MRLYLFGLIYQGSFKKITVPGRDDKCRMIMVIFQEHNDHMKSLVGKDFSSGTLERYKNSFDHITAFLEWKYTVRDMDIKKPDYEVVSQYEFWLKTFRKCV